MSFSHTIRGERFSFADLRELFAKANEPKSGDMLAGITATSERQRVAAKLALADVPLQVIAETPVVDPGADDVSRLIFDTHARAALAPVRSLTGGECRALVLDDVPAGRQAAA